MNHYDKKLVDLQGANRSNTNIKKSPLFFHGKIDKFWYFHINEESESGFKIQRYYTTVTTCTA